MKYCCVIGNPIKQSLSPLIHKAAYQALGIGQEFDYFARQLEFDELSNFIEDAEKNSLIGISVTIPYKTEVLKYVNQIDPDAQRINAINTIVINQGLKIGYNTDCYGIEQSIRTVLGEKIKNALVIGAGGAARSAIIALKSLGSKVNILNRTPENAIKLVHEFNLDACSSESVLNSKYDLLINTTPVGMFPNISEQSVTSEIIKNVDCVFDTIYNPKHTELIKAALKMNKEVIFGSKMFIYQAAKQFELYTGHPAPLEVMEESLRSYLKHD